MLKSKQTNKKYPLGKDLKEMRASLHSSRGNGRCQGPEAGVAGTERGGRSIGGGGVRVMAGERGRGAERAGPSSLL